MSNAERIRDMTNEELADFLCEVKSDYGWDFPGKDDYAEWKKWLELESE